MRAPRVAFGEERGGNFWYSVYVKREGKRETRESFYFSVAACKRAGNVQMQRKIRLGLKDRTNSTVRALAYSKMINEQNTK